jgi:hypothetical protein
MKAFVVARYQSLLLCITALQLLLGAAVYASEGKWSFTHDPRGHPELTYLENGKTLFFLGVGRAIGLWIAYPGPPQPDKEDEVIEIRTATEKWVMRGDLVNDHGFDRGVTYFRQWDLGVDRASTPFDNLGAKWSKFIKSLAASREIEITTKVGNVVLPGITVKDISQQFGSVYGSTP